MKMAKASEKDMEAAAVIMGILTDLDSGYFPRLPDPDAEPDENEPTFFDEDDEEHLRILHDRLKAALDLAPGCLGRVIGGFHTLMHNDIVDPDEDCLALHPRIVAALATAEEAKPVPEEQNSLRDAINKIHELCVMQHSVVLRKIHEICDKALEPYTEEKKPVPEDQRSGAEKLADDLAGVEYQSAQTDLPSELWQVGDIVSRDGNDEQEILDFAGERDFISVKCVKEPPVSEGLSEPWCRLGDLETNLTRRYSFVRPGLRAVTSTLEVREDKDQPLQCGVEDDRLVISIGVDTLAFADKERTGLNINDPTGFAGDVVRMLTHEDETGWTLLSGLLDTASQAVADDGSEFIDFK